MTSKKEGNPTNVKKRILKFVCPFCYAYYEFYKAEITENPPKCDYCSIPLVERKEHIGKEMKCFDCLMAVDTPDGIWCLKFKGIVTELITDKCQEFISKSIISREERDDYEG